MEISQKKHQIFLKNLKIPARLVDAVLTTLRSINMNGKHLSVGISLFFALSGACLAATPVSQGVIQFHGSIVESGCTSRVGASSMFEFNDCQTKVSEN
jgi:hypothetical protein